MSSTLWIWVPAVAVASFLIVGLMVRSQRSAMMGLAQSLALDYVAPRHLLDAGGARGAVGPLLVEVELGIRQRAVDGAIASYPCWQLRCSGPADVLDTLAGVPDVEVERVDPRTLVISPRTTGGVAAQRELLPQVVGLVRATLPPRVPLTSPRDRGGVRC